ncbi:uncharacterized protein M421DRAFT_424693 [Didymella exigua CBS 183.55]|uniref:Uncharacterized protein n=1 Tax=Didymella exigua CBS 183.55 TaxID=1150837 RepID=A0A6A5RB46_9PLEO|nr:uncharacterized protein M421DRAFT_424693 [Didymella exigua CBS 183.55]KAF1924559.1 hypothetical protein M421DRAFT_424693 [Didymella exigua CBS 183.55]
MMAFCPSAHFLLLLTRGDYGFCNLRFLHLHIRVDDQWHKADEQFLQVLEEVKFVVKASRVELIVSDLFGDVKEEHQEVRKRIIVVE